MKKYEIVKENTLFNDIIKTGKCLKNKYYNIYYKDGLNKNPMFGIAVSKKCGIAVERNKIKRRIRMIIDNNKFLFENNCNYIIMVRKNILNISFQDMEKYLKELIEKGTKHEEKN